MKFNWKKFGLLLKPNKNYDWMVSHTGSSYPIHKSGDIFDLYVTGRDSKNRSSIGKATLDLSQKPKILSIEKKPIIKKGVLGAFDENGVSYPDIVKTKNETYLYYTGWSPGKITPFQNQLGLAFINNGFAKRLSNAPIMDRNKNDYISVGGSCVMNVNNTWKMWYTSFLKWEKVPAKKPKHYYLIKYAYSKDGINWIRENQIAINFKNSNEYAICRPSVIFQDEIFHMVFCSKGENYKLGYATSLDGVSWQRSDSKLSIDLSKKGWDSKEMCYPSIFKHKEFFYLIYAGNDYGNAGIGIARSKI
tara:strand:- start:106 stop:1017 length:912 start_codon:yes stop_codon:yes gene_type:complete